MGREVKSAFYALHPGTWRDYVNLLHLPYTLWHLSYVVMGAAAAPSIHWERLAGTLLAFFLAVGISAHALDELNSRPLRTTVPAAMLVALAAASLVAAVSLGIIAGFMVTFGVLPFVAFGAFMVVAYNLELWGGRFHSDFWFAMAWGAFPMLTAYWINALQLSLSAVLMAGFCFCLSLAQRTLSTQVRAVRRRSRQIEGRILMADGSVLEIDSNTLIGAPERALLLLNVSVITLAVALLSLRIP